MKTLKTILLCYLLSLNLPAAVGAADIDQERSILREMLTQIESALNDKNVDAILPMLDKDAVIVFLNGEVARGEDQILAYFEKTLSGGSAILNDYATRAEVGAPARFVNNIAIADGTTQDTFFFADGSEIKVNTFWTATLQKTDGKWKIIQLHFSTNLFDNPLVSALETKLLLFVSIAIIIGLVIGILIGRRRSKHAPV